MEHQIATCSERCANGRRRNKEAPYPTGTKRQNGRKKFRDQNEEAHPQDVAAVEQAVCDTEASLQCCRFPDHTIGKKCKRRHEDPTTCRFEGSRNIPRRPTSLRSLQQKYENVREQPAQQTYRDTQEKVA